MAILVFPYFHVYFTPRQSVSYFKPIMYHIHNTD